MEKKDFFSALCRQVKFCPLEKALLLAEKCGYEPVVVSAIIERPGCSFSRLWELLQKTSRVFPIMKSVAMSGNFRKISFVQFLSLFARAKKEGGNNPYCIYDFLEIADQRKILNKFSVEQLLDFSNKIGYLWPVINNIGRKKSWKELEFDFVFDILQQRGGIYDSNLARIVISRKDCCFEKAMEILISSDEPSDVLSAIIGRKDFKIDRILRELEMQINKKLANHERNIVSFEALIAWNAELIISRKDCSISRAYEILEITKKVDKGSFESAVMALIKKNNLSFNKTLDLMKLIDCTKMAIPSFEKRKDFVLERRIELIETMQASVSDIYAKRKEPDFDHFNLNKIIVNGDWVTPSLYEVLNLNKRVSYFDSPLKIISERKDWKKLSLSQAIKLAARTGNQNSVLQLIINQKKCPLEKALELAKLKNPDVDFYDSHLLQTIIEKGLPTHKESLDILAKSDDSFCTASVIVERKDTIPLDGMVNLYRNGFSNLANLSSAAAKHDDWKTISLEKVFDYLKDITYDGPLSVIVQREDWKTLPFQTAYDYLNSIDWSRHYQIVIPSLTAKKDCPLDSALKLLNLLEHERDNRDAIMPVTQRLDYPLEDALELAKSSYYECFKGIVLRKDWQELSLTKVFEYIEKYPNHSMLDYLSEREDWRALPIEEALKKLVGLESYYRLLYLGLIVRQETYPFEKSLLIVEKYQYDHLISNQIIRRGDCSLDQASIIFKKADSSASMFKAIASRDDWNKLPLKEALDFAKKTAPGFYSLIVEREDWKALSLAKSLKFADKYDYNNWLIESIARRKDWQN